MSDSLWDHIEVTAARRDNLTTDDAPRQQPMKANIKPAQRKKPSADQKKFRRAQTRKQGHVDGCPECGSTDATPDENHKDEYRCNYCGTVYQPGTGHVVSSISDSSTEPSSTHPAKEASMTSNPTPAQPSGRPTEADLLTRLATATTLADQTRIAEQIEDLRAGARDTVSYLGSLDWDAMTAPAPTWAETLGTHLYPIHEGSLHTGHGLTDATEWMDDLVVPTSLDDSEMTARMRSQATLWYTTEVWEPVKADPGEFAVQSRNAAVRAGSVAGLQSEAAQSVFLEQVRHLASRDGIISESEWGTDSMRPGPDPTVDTYVSDGRDSLPVGVDPAKADTHDDGPDSEGKDPKTKTDAGVQQSLSEGSPPEGDHSESIENPLSGDTSLDKSKGEYGTDTSDRMLTQSGHTAATCSCAHNSDGSVTTSLCPTHASEDPCETMAAVTGRRRRGSIIGGICTNCGWHGRTFSSEPEDEHPGAADVGIDWFDPTGTSYRASRHTAGGYGGGSPKSGDTATCHKDGGAIQFFDGQWMHLKGTGSDHNDVYPATPKEQADKGLQRGKVEGPGDYAKGSALHTAAEGRPLYEIADEIRRVWRPLFYGAVPYLDAMSQMSSISDRFYDDSGQTVVAYFLSNTKTWRGDDARRIKAELRAMQTRRMGSKQAGSVNDLTGMGTCSVCGDKIAKDPSGENPSTWHHDNGETHDHEAKPGGGSKTSAAITYQCENCKNRFRWDPKAKGTPTCPQCGSNSAMSTNKPAHDAPKMSAKYAISLTQVGVDPATGNGQGTTSDGTRVTFRLTDQERKDLKSVLFSDLAVNFSGVDVDPGDIITEQGGGNSMSGPSRSALLDIDAQLADVFSRPYGSIETYSTQTYADVLRSDRGLGEGIDEGDSPEGDHSEPATQEQGQGANDASTGTDADRPDGGINWGAGGGAAKDQTGAYTSSLTGNLSENLTGNARVFVATLEQMSSLDDEIDGITGHQVAHLLAREPGIPDSLREALRGGDNPFEGAGDQTRKEATRYCPNHKVYVGEGNQEQHDHCPVQTRKKKDSSKQAARTGPTIDDPKGVKYTPAPEWVAKACRRRFEGGGTTAVHPTKQGWYLHGVENFWDGPSEVKDNGDHTLSYTNPYDGNTDVFDETGYNPSSKYHPNNAKSSAKTALTVNGPDGKSVELEEGECRTCGAKALGHDGHWVHDPRHPMPSHPDGSVAGDAHAVKPLKQSSKQAAGRCPGVGAPMKNQRERNTTDSKFFGWALGECPSCGKAVRSKSNKTPQHAPESKTSAKQAGKSNGTTYDGPGDLPKPGDTVEGRGGYIDDDDTKGVKVVSVDGPYGPFPNSAPGGGSAYHWDVKVDAQDGSQPYSQTWFTKQSAKTASLACEACGSPNVVMTIAPGGSGSGPGGGWRMGDVGGSDVLQCKDCGHVTNQGPVSPSGFLATVAANDEYPKTVTEECSDPSCLYYGMSHQHEVTYANEDAEKAQKNHRNKSGLLATVAANIGRMDKQAGGGMDRSVIFSCLLALSPEFGRLESQTGSAVISRVEAAWDANPAHTDLYEFTREWLATHHMAE